MSRVPRSIGPYQIERRLGAGNMGVVFQAYHPQLDARYALKVLRTDLCTPHDLARFQREIELVAAVSEHPNVVGIHTAAEDQGRIYYVMELVDGEDLQARVSRGPLPSRQAARYVAALARAVADLHAKGIVHRDIKPANVLVGGDDRPRLTDFGLARAFTDDQNRLTKTGEMIGTPFYMSPEQTTGRPAGPEADVYALGMLLYTLLAGEPAVQGESALEVIDKIRRGGHRPLAELAPQAPEALARVCREALAMDPRVRPSAAALAERLETFLSGSGGGRSARAAAARRLVLGVAAVVVLGVLVIGGIALDRSERASVAADLTSQVAAAEQALSRAEGLLGQGAGGADLAEALATARAPLDAAAEDATAPPGLPGLRGALLAREGEAALAAGNTARARACLAAAEALVESERGPGLRELKRAGLACLRGGLEALDPREDDSYGPGEALRDLARAREREPQRVALATWRVQVAARSERPQEALADLEAHPDPQRIPAPARAQVWLAAGQLDAALALLPQLEPAQAAGIHYEAGLAALREEHLERALEHLAPAARAAPDDPRRRQALELARGALRRADDWRRGAAPRVLGNALWGEVRAASLVRALDPAFSLERERVDEIYGALSEVGGTLRQETIEIVHALIEVVPDDVALYKLFAALSVDYGLPQPARDMAVIRQGLTRAGDPADRRLLLEQLALALYRSQHLEELTTLANAVQQEDHDGPLKAFVVGRVGDLLRYQGKLEQARTWIDRARTLDPDGYDLHAFEYAFHRVRFDRDQEEADREAALGHARALIGDYRPGSWDEWLPDICVWVCLQEESRGRYAEASRALDLLNRFHPEQLRWAAHRLVLRCQETPFPAAQLDAELGSLRAQLVRAAEELEAAAEADPAQEATLVSRASSLRRLDLRHLDERLALGQARPLQEGLLQLEATLLQLGF